MNHLKKTSLIICIGVFLTACGSTPEQQNAAMKPLAPAAARPISQAGTANNIKGVSVPPNLVCMVNDVFMNKEQIAVPFEGKTYYWCCEMCKNRIPLDATVRKAIDPATGKTVDKASAYIVITGNNSEVSYFESVATYKKFMQQPNR